MRLELKHQTQAHETKNHFVSFRHLTHDDDGKWNTYQPEKVEVHRHEQKPAAHQEKRYIRHTKEHGGTGTTSKDCVFLHN